MATAASVTPAKFGVLVRLRKMLLENPRPLLKKIGLLLTASTEKAFLDQALGEHRWPARYPNQSGAKLNIAGAIMDLGSGPSIKAHRFNDRPALSDTGNLRRSFASENAISYPGKFTVQVGTVFPYASIHQTGGESTLSVSSTVRANLKEYLGKKRKGKKQKAQKSIVQERMGFLLNRTLGITEMSISVNRRPFLGVTPQVKDQILSTVADAGKEAR